MWTEKYPNVKFSIITITPELAKQWVDTMPVNRKPRPKHVEGLVEAIMNDEWKMNGQTFLFNTKGQMIDGQHRALAVIMAGKSIESVIIEGIEDDAKSSIDIGVTRSVKDHLVIAGVNVSAALESAIHTVYKLAQSKLGKPENWVLDNKMSRLHALPSHSLAIYQQYPEMSEMLTKVRTHPFGLRGNMVGVALVYGLLDKQQSDEWLSVINENIPKELETLFSSYSGMHNLKRIAHLVNNINSVFDVEPIEIMWDQSMPPIPEEVKNLI